jgi:hypothetical protein
MRLLDTYAVNCGARIDKPFVYTSYFPLPIEKYITFQAQSKFDSKDYSYWQDVINILFPVLDKNGIKIVQVGIQNETPYNFTVDLRGRTNIPQLAYIIQKSLTHFGPDSFGVHLASTFDVPLVGLYSVIQSSVAGPHFGTKEKQILFDSYLRTENKKPSYAAQESPKSINLIRPEEIAEAVLKLLGIDFKVDFKTIYIGEKYGARVVREFVPDKVTQLPNPEIPIEIRMDLNFDEQILAQQLSFCKGAIITNRPINKDLLKGLRPNIAAIVYEITEDDEPQFVESLKEIGIQTVLISYLPTDKIQEKKISYYDHGKITEIKLATPELIEKLRVDIDKLYYRSNKIMSSQGKFFMGNATRVQNIELTNEFEYQKVNDTTDFWRDIDFVRIIKKLD